jgi:hypothetical protein
VADKIVRIIVLGSTSDAEAKMVALGATTDKVSDGMSSSIGAMTTKTGGLFTKLGNRLNALGVPFAGTLTSIGTKLDNTSTKGQHFAQAMTTAGGAVVAAGTVAAIGITAAALKMGMDLQSTEANIASAADISQKKASAIGNAFAGTAFKVQYSAVTIGQAFAGTAGQFEQIEGHALNVKQSMGVMSASMNLAEATQTDLGGATSALAKIMQTFQIPLRGANDASNILYNTSRTLGLGLSQVAQQTARMKSRMGALGPTLGQMGGLLVDLTAHGETGRMAMSALGSTITKLIQPSTNYLNALQKQKELQGDLSPQLQNLASEYASGQITATQYSAATKYLTQSQQQSINAYSAQLTAAENAKNAMQESGVTAFNTAGKFVGFGAIIDQLNAKMAGETQQQKLATLSQALGTQASVKLLQTVEAGPAAYAKYTEEVERKNSAEKAAEVQEATLKHQLDDLKSGIEDYGEKLGIFLIPKLKDLVAHVIDIVKWFTKHKEVAIALAGTITAVLGVAVGFFIESKLVKFGKFMKSGVQDIQKFGSACQKIVGKILGMGQATTTAAAETEAAGETTQLTFEGMATTAETTAPEIDAAIGSTGIGAVLIGLGIAIALVATHWRQCWKEVKDIAVDAWHFLEHDFLDPIKSTFKVDFQIIKTILLGPFAYMSTLKKIWDKAWLGIKDTVKDVWNFIKHIIDDMVNGFKRVGHDIGSAFGGLGHLVGLASGGTAMAGQSYIVGEHGPEIFTPGVSGTVSPNGSTKSVAGGNNITITGINMANPAQVAAEVAWALKTSPSGTM